MAADAQPLDASGNWAINPGTDELLWTGPAPATPQQVWQIQAVSDLWQAGPTCRRAARYLIEHNTEIGFARQDASSARWWFNWRTRKWIIQLDPRCYSMDAPRGTPAYAAALAAIAHEARHLEQGPLLALSVLGEVEGWKTGETARQELGLPSRQDTSLAYVINLPDSLTDEELKKARAAMLARSPSYRAWALPLRPAIKSLPEYLSTLYKHRKRLWQLIKGR